jgi:hypothetical protein
MAHWSKGLFQKEKHCDGLTDDHTSPLMIVLRSSTWNGTSTVAPVVPALPSNGDIGRQIDEIAKSGRYTTLPQAQATTSGGYGLPNISLENQTAYELTVMVAGPLERSVTISPGSSQTVTLPVGTYRVVGRINASNVLPFFGTQQFSAGTSYQESFYVTAH